jgi:hypothetical protein
MDHSKLTKEQSKRFNQKLIKLKKVDSLLKQKKNF